MSFAAIEARIAEAADVDERRGATRLPVAIEARVRPFGEEGRAATILNISDSGFMAETSAHYEVGARVWLILPGRERANAVVKWTAGTKLGAEFAAPLRLAKIGV